MTSEFDGYDEIGEMLSNFPTPIYLRTDKNRPSGALYVSIPAFLISVLALCAGNDLRMRLSGGFTAFVFGVITIFCILALNVKDYYLKLDKDGFTMRWWFQESSYQWQCVDKFEPFLNPFARGLTSRDFSEIGVSFRWSKDGNSEHGRPATFRVINNTYGLRVSELIRLLTGWRKRALELKNQALP